MLVIATDREIEKASLRRTPPGLLPGAIRPLTAWGVRVHPETDQGLPVLTVSVVRAQIKVSLSWAMRWRLAL